YRGIPIDLAQRPAGPGIRETMERASVVNPGNIELIEDYYARWRSDPASVERSWQIFFEGYDFGRETGATAAGAVDLDAARAQAAVTRLVDAYREYGHYLADLDPLKLGPRPVRHDLLDPSAFGLSESDWDRVYYSPLCDEGACNLRKLITILRQTYCR